MTVSLRVNSAAFKADLRRIDRRVDRATMWGLREVGRQLKRAEKKRAPVYKGPNGVRRLKKGAIGPMQNGPIIGLLKMSIGSARSFKRLGPHTYGLVVGPRGGRVNLYKGKIERQYGFVQQSYDQVVPTAPVIMARGWERALQRGRR